MRPVLVAAVLALCGCAEAYAPEAVTQTVKADAEASDTKAAIARGNAEERGAERAKEDLRWADAKDAEKEREKN